MKCLVSILLGVLSVAVVFGQTISMPPLSLTNAEQIALKQHPQIAQANYLVLAAQEAVTETRAGFFPTANVYADVVGVNNEGTRIMAGGLNNPSVYDRGAGGIQVN